jgi:trimeric autotransporter adhesin
VPNRYEAISGYYSKFCLSLCLKNANNIHMFLELSQIQSELIMKTKLPCQLITLVILLGINHVAAQGTAFTYQGRVTDSGTNFNGSGQFEFALVTSTNANHTATATANAPSGGYITGYNLISVGNGYSGSTATVTISGGGGSGAAAHANIGGGMVMSITVDNPGNGLYTSAPTVTIAAPPADITYTTYWSNDGTSVNGSEPTAAVNVTLNSGLFTVVLGDTTLPNMAAIDASLFNQPDLQLRIWFNDGVNGYAALDPAQNLTPTPYAVFANTASNLVNGISIQQNTNDAPNVVGGSSVNYVADGVVGATIGGGGAVDYTGVSYTNSIGAFSDFSTIGGGQGNIIQTNAFGSTIGGGEQNTIQTNAFGSTIAGGEQNTIQTNADHSAIGGGWHNFIDINNYEATIAGGYYNSISNNADYSTIGGGVHNTINVTNSYYGYDYGLATVAGGGYNLASGYYATVAGGYDNIASGIDATVGGGYGNTASGEGATVSGGEGNSASGNFSFAAGQQAQAMHTGAFVWADSQNTTFASTGNDQFLIRAQGGVGIGTGSPLEGDLSINTNTYLFSHIIYLRGGTGIDHNHGLAYCGPTMTNFAPTVLPDGPVLWGYGGGVLGSSSGGNHAVLTWNSSNVSVVGTVTANGVLLTSDRNAKENFTPLDNQSVLAKVAALPVTEWNYKTDSRGVQHIGPMAQDFQAAFRLDGGDDKHISVVDEGGVALAAIQGLNQKLQEELNRQDAENTKLKQQNDSLAQRLNELEATVKQLAANK